MISDWCRYFHDKRLKLPSSYIPSEEEIKSSPYLCGCFSLCAGNLKSHCALSNHFHQRVKDPFDNVTKKKTEGESEADRAKRLLSTSERKHLSALLTNKDIKNMDRSLL